MCAMIVESLSQIMPNWDCTTMLCTVKRPFECTQCCEKGSGVQKFKNHMRKHAQKKVHKCDMCQFETPSPWKSEEAYETSYNCNSEDKEVKVRYM